MIILNILVNGSWSNWEVWTSCSTTCGNGTASRNRTCDDPPPSGGGDACLDRLNQTRLLNETESMLCFEDHCPGMFIHLFINLCWSDLSFCLIDPYYHI